METRLKWNSYEEWNSYGIEQDYEKRNPSSLIKSEIFDERSWYTKGRDKKWLRNFEFNRIIETSEFNNFEEWEKYGVKYGFNNRNYTSLQKSKKKKERSWFYRGYNKKWIKDFDFTPLIGFNKFNNFEEWEEYGIKYNYNKSIVFDLIKSKNKNDRSWCNKGYREGWIKNFRFENGREFNKFNTFEEWEKYGIKKGYGKENPKSLIISEDKNERSWYSLGQRKGWLKDFNFSRIIEPSKFNTFEEWEEYGIGMRYNKTNSSSIGHSENKKERSWYTKGRDKNWLKNFSFKPKKNRWKTKEEWIQFGLNNNYNQRNPWSLCDNKNLDERSWYRRGGKKKWLRNFEFKPKKNRWKTKEEWIQFGLNNNYDKTNPTNIQRSKDGIRWYRSGVHKNWLKEFDFRKLKGVKIKSQKQLEKFLDENQQAKELASLATIDNYISNVADILAKLWPERFPSSLDLARTLPKVVKGLGHCLVPFTLEKAKGFRDIIESPPKEVQSDLDELLFSIVCDQYQISFNNNPVGTLEEIKSFADNSSGIGPLALKVLRYYEEIYSFDIPGYGKINDYIITKE